MTAIVVFPIAIVIMILSMPLIYPIVLVTGPLDPDLLHLPVADRLRIQFTLLLFACLEFGTALISYALNTLLGLAFN